MSLAHRSQKILQLTQYRWLHVLLGIVVSTGFAYLAARSLAWRDVLETFKSFPSGAILLALVPLGAAMLLRALRWYVLLRGEAVQFLQVVLTQNTGIGLNNMSPIRMVSEPVQLALITRRYRVPFPTAFATLVGGNVMDIIATALLMALGILLVPSLREGQISIQLVGAFIMFVVSVLVFVAVARGLHNIPLANRVRFFQQIVVAISLLRDKPLRLLSSFVATVGHWCVLGVAGWVLAGALEIDVLPLTMATILVAATFFTSAVPSAPAGAGTYHFAIVTMLTGLGTDPTAAFSFAVVMHIMFVVPSSIIALLMIGRVGLTAILTRADAAVEPKYRPLPSGAAPGANDF